MKFFRMLLGTLLSACLVASGANAAWPEKPIKIIVPYPPGGLTDAVARQVGSALAERLKQPVVIENIAGGGGNIGAERAAKAPADGYTLYLWNNATVGLNTLVYKGRGRAAERRRREALRPDHPRSGHQGGVAGA